MRINFAMADAERPVSMKQADELVELGKQSSRYANPNPDRVDCPSDHTLRAMALRSRHLSLTDAPVAHVANCSPCYQQYCRYREEEIRRSRRRYAAFAICAAAAIIVAVLIGRNVLRSPASNSKPSIVDRRPSQEKEKGPAAESPPPQLLALDLRHMSPSRGDDEPGQKAQVVVMPAKALKLEVLLPVASPPGSYELGVFSVAHIVQQSAKGTATLDNGVTRLSVSTDLTSLKSGAYLIGVRTALSDWMFTPVTIR
jgi:hypothetical protein